MSRFILCLFIGLASVGSPLHAQRVAAAPFQGPGTALHVPALASPGAEHHPGAPSPRADHLSAFVVGEFDAISGEWLKWGLVGAGVGAVTFAVLGRMSVQPNPVLHDAALGAATGFVTIGGGVALYEWICAPGSWSRKNGLCSRQGDRRGR